jgi:hypothetical protein
MQAKFDQSSEEFERLKIEGDQNSVSLMKTIEEKDIYIAELLKKLLNGKNVENEKNVGNDFRDLESMEGGLVDVRKQIALAATIIKVLFLFVCNNYLIIAYTTTIRASAKF